MMNEQMGGSESEGFANDFMVIKVVFHALDILVVFVAFTGNEDNISWLSHHTCCADGLASINDADDLALVLGRCNSGKHIIDDVLGLLEAGIVRRDDDAV